ncbi:hypothetical protein [Candidatus Nitrospira bockiana]
MTSRRWIGALATALMLQGGLVPAQAQVASDDVRLQVLQQEVDEDAAAKVQKTNAEALAKQFQVQPKVVEELRAAKQGWGEITIRMALAQELTKADPKAYPTMTEALAKVGDLRSAGMGWGKIANDLGFKLGPLVSEVNRVRQELRAETKVTTGTQDPSRLKGDEARGPAKEKTGERAQRPDRLERAQRPERPERPQRPERPERMDRPDRPERPGR